MVIDATTLFAFVGLITPEHEFSFFGPVGKQFSSELRYNLDTLFQNHLFLGLT